MDVGTVHDYHVAMVKREGEYLALRWEPFAQNWTLPLDLELHDRRAPERQCADRGAEGILPIVMELDLSSVIIVTSSRVITHTHCIALSVRHGEQLIEGNKVKAQVWTQLKRAQVRLAGFDGGLASPAEAAAGPQHRIRGIFKTGSVDGNRELVWRTKVTNEVASQNAAWTI